MRWSELVTALDATVLVDGPDFEFGNCAAADLLSDILSCEKENFVVFTGQVSPQALRTAIAVGALAMVVVRGKPLPPETIALAQNNGVPLAVTRLRMFETCVTAGERLWSCPSTRS